MYSAQYFVLGHKNCSSFTSWSMLNMLNRAFYILDLAGTSSQNASLSA